MASCVYKNHVGRMTKGNGYPDDCPSIVTGTVAIREAMLLAIQMKLTPMNF